MARILNNQLQELIDNPNETLEVEHKSWLDLSDDNEARADLARHIAAIANHGGGSIVFGLDDVTMKFAGPNPFPKVNFNRDLISGIVKRYLEPTFQCDIQIIRSEIGNDHPIILVPPHGSAPICAKADGPQVNGKPRGIAQGIYYTRKPGPESAPILTSTEWTPIIRRCAMHERTAILGAIDLALRGPAHPNPTSAEALKAWHDAAHSIYLEDVQKYAPGSILEKSHVQFSYAIGRQDNQKLDPSRLIDVLRRINSEVEDLVRTGWSMFYPFSPQEIAPYFSTDPNAGIGDEDFIQAALLRDPRKGDGISFPDMWRVSADGKATIIRNYWEDDLGFSQGMGLKPGSWFSPNMLVRSLAELVRHARGFSERFDNPTTISFLCEWHGLEDRMLADPQAMWSLRRALTRANHRTISRTWPVSAAAGSWVDIVAELAAPIVRLFMPDYSVTSEWVTGQAPKWLR